MSRFTAERAFYAIAAGQVVYAIGATACTVMMSTCQGEYITDKCRGRWIGVVAIINALGVVVMIAVFSKLPAFFGQAGLSDINALRASFWVCSIAALLLAIVLHFGLQAPNRGATGATPNLFRQTAKGVTLVKRDPLLGLSYLTAFASKGDLVIVTTFLSLWVTQAGIAAGMSPAEAAACSGLSSSARCSIGSRAWSGSESRLRSQAQVTPVWR